MTSDRWRPLLSGHRVCSGLAMHLSLMSRWFERPYLLIFPLIGVISSIGLLKSVQRRNDLGPFRFSALIFVAAFGTLACSFA